LRLERLGQHAVTTGGRRLGLIDRFERAREQHDRNMRKTRRALDVLRDLVAVLARHADVGQHDVGRRLVQPRDRLVAVADRYDLYVLVGERELDYALDRDAVVGQQQGMRHLWSFSVGTR
jgi:hypothetical protein